MRLALPILLAATLAAPSFAQTPIKEIWEPLIPGAAVVEERQRLTELAAYRLVQAEISEARKRCRKKNYCVRLRVIGAFPPKNFSGSDLALVHGQYVDEEHQKLFGKDATVGIWTRDHDTAESLAIGDEIELSGPAFIEVHYPSSDVEKYRLKSEWSEKSINTSVAFLRPDLTGFPLKVRVYLVNPQIRVEGQ